MSMSDKQTGYIVGAIVGIGIGLVIALLISSPKIKFTDVRYQEGGVYYYEYDIHGNIVQSRKVGNILKGADYAR